VHAEDGMDEISIGASTRVAELKDGRVRVFAVQPEDFGLKRADVATLAVATPEDSLKIIERVFANEAGAARDIVALNAGAAIYAAGLVSDLRSGVQRALEVIASGAARDKLSALIKLSRQLAAK